MHLANPVTGTLEERQGLLIQGYGPVWVVQVKLQGALVLKD
jgi:hypothetical protein